MNDFTPYTEEQYPNIPNAISEIAYADFKGAFPEVPLASGVDVAELTSGDGAPFFITLPIAEVGMVSANKLRYTEDFCKSLVEQINTDKPTGIRGHIKDAERSTAYPTPAIYWVGATLETDGKVWAKGYIPPGETREEYRIKKATAAAAATSIYGKPLMIHEHADGTYTPVLSLEQVDLAPPKRAAHGKGYGFAVTRELETAVEETGTMDKASLKDMLNGLSAQELVEMIGPALTSQIVEMNQKPTAEMAGDAPAIAEMQQSIVARDTTIAELEQTVTAQAADLTVLRERVVDSALNAAVEDVTDWNVKAPEGQQKLTYLRSILKKTAIAELGDQMEAEAIKGAVDKAMEENQFIVEMTRDNLAGPQAIAGANDNRSVGAKLLSREEIEAARMRVGL